MVRTTSEALQNLHFAYCNCPWTERFQIPCLQSSGLIIWPYQVNLGNLFAVCIKHVTSQQMRNFLLFAMGLQHVPVFRFKQSAILSSYVFIFSNASVRLSETYR